MGNSVIDYPWEFAHLPAGGLVLTGAGMLHTIVLNGTTVAGQTTIYDGVDATGSVIAVLAHTQAAPQISCQPITLTYDCKIDTGIFVVVDAGAADLTVTYK